MITEAQFNDALSRIFLRFDEMDEKMDRQYKQLRASIDHVSNGLDETNARLDETNATLKESIETLKRFQEEQHAFNMKMDERLLRLEDVTGA